MSSPGFEPSPYGTAVSVVNHYTGRATLKSYYLATQGLLAMDPVIVNHNQVTRTNLEMVSFSPNYLTTTTGGRSSLHIFSVLQPPLHDRYSAIQGSNS
ncbi:hypothetical protein TNCV_1120561 [Trichonephila clavipes]|uniref:Uncharacterized protein n=1 Tax=Trichonephila clavipes TaxID=2585209 RepID=A0A8X6SVH8_TRICX|nr:hypothetical protein TNCV_1120561 [Trichonephila clavipes]